MFGNVMRCNDEIFGDVWECNEVFGDVWECNET